MVIIARVVSITLLLLFLCCRGLCDVCFWIHHYFEYCFYSAAMLIEHLRARHWSEWTEHYNPCPLETCILVEGYRMHESKADDLCLTLWNLVFDLLCLSLRWPASEAACGSLVVLLCLRGLVAGAPWRHVASLTALQLPRGLRFKAGFLLTFSLACCLHWLPHSLPFRPRASAPHYLQKC